MVGITVLVVIVLVVSVLVGNGVERCCYWNINGLFVRRCGSRLLI